MDDSKESFTTETCYEESSADSALSVQIPTCSGDPTKIRTHSESSDSNQLTSDLLYKKCPENQQERLPTGKKRFVCNVCNNNFSHLSSLKRHIQLHTNDKSFACNVCDKSFRYDYSLKKHLLVHTGEKPFVCTLCGQTFSQDANLRRHTDRVHTAGVTPLVCDLCDVIFTRKSDLRSHMRDHAGDKPHVCNVCHRRFSLKSFLTKHLRVHSGERPYVCGVCNKGFTQDSGLTAHLRIHTGEKPFSCDVCNRRFSDESSCKRHKRVHSGEKPFACDVCNKRFSRKSALRAHVPLHARETPVRDVSTGRLTTDSAPKSHLVELIDEKPFLSNRPDDNFSQESCVQTKPPSHPNVSQRAEAEQKDCRASLLNDNDATKLPFSHIPLHSMEKHVRDISTGSLSTDSTPNSRLQEHTDKKPLLICYDSDTGFSQTDPQVSCDVPQLVQHSARPGDKRHACHVCDRRFSLKSLLTKHLRVHTGEKPFVCGVCNKGFAQDSNLTAHLRIHTGEKSVACEMCNKCFTDESSCRRHKRVHSGEKPFVCDVCNKGFSRKSTLRAHVPIHARERPVRDVSTGSLSPDSTLKNHLGELIDEKPLLCNRSNHNFSQESCVQTKLPSILTAHIPLRSKEGLVCDVSAGSISGDSISKTHLGEPFLCNNSNDNFSQESYVQTKLTALANIPEHARTGQSFTTDSSPKSHLGELIDEKPFLCSISNNNFSQDSCVQTKLPALTHVHQLVEAEQKDSCALLLNNNDAAELPFPSDVCNRSLTRDSDLKKHVLNHVEEKKFVCNMYNKMFL